MKLHEIPRGSKLMVRVNSSSELEPAVFHRIDGMYSLCTLNRPEAPIFHLYAGEEMKQVGDHYEIDTNPPQEDSHGI